MKKIVYLGLLAFFVFPSCSAFANSADVTYRVDDKTINFENFYVENSSLYLSIKSLYKLYQFSYLASVYNKNGSLITSLSDTVVDNVPSMKNFSFESDSNLQFSNVGYVNFEIQKGYTHDKINTSAIIEEKTYFYFYFDSNYCIFAVGRVAYKELPERMTYVVNPGINYYSFQGFSTNEYSAKSNYNYDVVGETNLCLYPVFSINTSSYRSSILNFEIQACIKVQVKYYNTFLFIETDSQTNTGSGVIFKRVGSSYYALTNHHVLQIVSGYSNKKYTITDYQKNTYSYSVVSVNPNSDLAIIKFDSSTKSFVPISLEETVVTPPQFKDVAAIGCQNNTLNTITIGKISSLESVTYTSGSYTYTFVALIHTATIAPGSSGGALIDYRKKLIGLNCASDSTINAAIRVDTMRGYID